MVLMLIVLLVLGLAWTVWFVYLAWRRHRAMEEWDRAVILNYLAKQPGSDAGSNAGSERRYEDDATE